MKSQKKGWSRSGGVTFLRKTLKNGEGGGWKNRHNRHFCMVLRNDADFSALTDKVFGACELVLTFPPEIISQVRCTTNSAAGLLFYYPWITQITQYYTLKALIEKVKMQYKSCICWCLSVYKDLRQHLSKGLWENGRFGPKAFAFWLMWGLCVCVCVADWPRKHTGWHLSSISAPQTSVASYSFELWKNWPTQSCGIPFTGAPVGDSIMNRWKIKPHGLNPV